jgi:hypothetical protein
MSTTTQEEETSLRKITDGSSPPTAVAAESRRITDTGSAHMNVLDLDQDRFVTVIRAMFDRETPV